MNTAAAVTTPTAGLAWTWRRFADLGVDDVYDALALRSRVFVLEQNCVYLDADGVDRQCWHLLGRHAASNTLHAYARVVDPGVKYAEPSLGRVITAPEMRSSGLGRLLVEQAVQRCTAAWPGRGMRISAQAHLAPFYAGFGFQGVGDTYLEDGIPHLEMARPG